MTFAKTLRVFVCLFVLALYAASVGAATEEVVEEPASASVATVQNSDSTEGADATDASGEESTCAERDEDAEDDDDDDDEEDDEGPACHGIVTCTFYAVGRVLALPFCLLGGLVSIII